MKENKVIFITVNALLIALVCVSTMVIQIPIPLGYMHLGNTCILLAGAMFGPVSGLLAGGIGSALADLLTGYTQWVLPTLIIKGIMGFVIGWIISGKGRTMRMTSVHTFLGSLAGIAVMIFGYFIGGIHFVWKYLYRRYPDSGTDSGRCSGNGDFLRDWLCTGKSKSTCCFERKDFVNAAQS